MHELAGFCARPIWTLRPVGLVAALIAVAGCQRFAPPPVPRGEPAHVAQPKAAIAEDTGALFADWPAAPDLALVVTGEMHGYLRPCGCSEGQHGGLARRGGFLEFLRKQKSWNVLPIDLGDLVYRGGSLEADRYGFAIESLEQLGYRAVGVGSRDLALSVHNVLGQAVDSKAKLVSANLEHVERDYQQLLQDIIPPVLVEEIGGVKVAVGSLIGPALAAEIPDRSIRLGAVEAAIERILAQTNDHQVELRILLAHLPPDQAQQLARDRPGFDLVICRSQFEDSASDEARWVGKTLVVWVGRKGKSAGVVGYWRKGDPRLRFSLVPLGPRFTELESLNEIYDQFVRSVKAGQYLEKAPRLPLPDGLAFVGAAVCGECHARAYEHWKTTPHAHALQTLERARPKGYQHYNVECVKCHVVGWQSETGFQTPDATPLLAGVQCENCHGPGSRHAADPDDPAARAQVRVTLEDAKGHGPGACIQCHDLENSLHFDFGAYWPKVEHPWRD